MGFQPKNTEMPDTIRNVTVKLFLRLINVIQYAYNFFKHLFEVLRNVHKFALTYSDNDRINGKILRI